MPVRMSKKEPLMAASALSREAKAVTGVRMLSAAKERQEVEPEGISMMLKNWLELM